MVEFDYEELRKATGDFSPERMSGKGSHGCIYKGEFKDGQVAAIKKWSSGLRRLHDNSKLENEFQVLSFLPKSPYLINLLGSSSDPDGNKVIVMEFMPNGSLHDLLHRSTDSQSISWSRRVQIAIQIAKGIQFLHSMKPAVIHRDIKPANVLFDKDWNAKLADFGLAIRVDSMTQPAGTIGYLDPCYTSPCTLNTKSDMFSFGVVLLEVVSGRKAIDISRPTTSIIDWALPLINQGRFNEIYDRKLAYTIFIEKTVARLLKIAARCVSPFEGNRPSIGDVVFEMERYFHLERIRFPQWMSFLKGIVPLRRSQKRTIRREYNPSSNRGLVTVGRVDCPFVELSST